MDTIVFDSSSSLSRQQQQQHQKKDKDISSHSKSKHSSSSSTKELNNKKKTSSHSSRSSDHHHHDHDQVEEAEDGEETSPVHQELKRKHLSDDNDDDDEYSDGEPMSKDSKKSYKSSKKSSHRDEKDKSSSKKEKSSSKRSSKSEITTEKKTVDNGASNNSAGSSDSLSIEETNKLRAKLGLKPLTITDNKKSETTTTDSSADVNSKKKYIDKDTNQEFEHMPAQNLAEKKEAKTFKEKLEQQREKRKLLEKLSTTKSIGNDLDDEDIDSAQSWLKKLKQKEEAAKKAKLLEEMDEQFGISDLVEEKLKRDPAAVKKNYTANSLKGLKVEHDESVFQEGKDIILTLKDRNILAGRGDDLDVDYDEEADVLVNVNLMDDEHAAKNVQNKKKQADYKPYDDFDDEGSFREKTILDKYNEELDGIKKKSFKLGKQGEFDASDSKMIERLNQEHKSRAIKLDALNELKFATDYLTPQELEKFKKPKKIRKGLRKNKLLKADDLLPLPDQNHATKKNSQESNGRSSSSTVKPESTSIHKTEKVISLKDIDFGFKNSDDEDGELNDQENSDQSDQDDFDLEKLKQNEKEKQLELEIAEEENNALEELQNILNKTRNKSLFPKTSSIPEIKHEEAIKENGVDFDNLSKIDEDQDDNVTLDTMSEFCRNLGTTGNKQTQKRANKSLTNDDSDNPEDKIDHVTTLTEQSENPAKKPESDSEDDDMDGISVASSDSEEENNGLLEDEPALNRGLGSCLNLAVTKGYFAHEKEKKLAKVAKESIEAVNFTIEEKNHYDIDDKYNRNRDRFSGPLMDFDEKSNYKPEVKIDYIDEKGHNMNEKEAFRYLSHKFHGKGSGKKKTEKRYKKIKEMESMNKMSSTDTPLNTVAMLVEKQKRLQQPYVVLSNSKGKQDQVTLHKR